MRAVVQRVSRAHVSIDGEVIGKVGRGLLALVGISADDKYADVELLVKKIVNLRIMGDASGRMNLSLIESGGELLIISQFTLYADTRRGRRPSYLHAAAPDVANGLYLKFVDLAGRFISRVETGRFQADMQIELVNDGPVTIIMDTNE